MRKFIFFWFLAVGLISLIGAAWIGRSMKLTATGFYESDVADGAAETVVHDTAEAVAHALDHGGVSTLHDLERRLDPKRKLRLFVFDPDLHEVAGGPAPESIRAFAGSLRSEGNAPFDGKYTEETFTVRTQAARFGTKCGVYAPLYRQRTLLAPSNPKVDYGAIAYADVLDAFRYYLGNLNGGRPFVLMGHSQGAGHLRRLIAEEIDPNPKLRDRLISALLLGGAVGVPAGKDVGGSFKHVAACRATTDVGCVVSYSSFRSTRPPPADSLFARVREPGQRALCTNPASLGGGSAPLVSYFDARGTAQLIGKAFNAFAADVAHPPEISTPFVALPGLVSAACVDAGPFSYLELTVHPDPGPRVDDIGGDLTAQWGMHLVDVNVALGNLVDLVRQQAKAWLAAH